MDRRVFLRAASVTVGATVFTRAASLARAERSSNNREQLDASAVELFTAIAADQIAVTVIPRDEKEVRLLIENKTKEPLSIVIPTALAGLPVLAQFGPLFGGQGQNNPFGPPANNGNGAGSPLQAIGIGVPQGNNIGINNRNRLNRGIFNIPSGKIGKLTFPSVCLEFGKREPNPRSPYQLKPLASFNDSPALRETLESLADERCSQETAQLVAWHISNQLSWTELAKMTERRAFGAIESRFSSSAIRKAKQFYEQLPANSQTPAKQDSSTTTSLAERR